MEIQQINTVKFGQSSTLLKTGTKASKKLVKFSQIQNSLVNGTGTLKRATLQKSSKLQPLNMTLEDEAKNFVIGMTMVNGFNGFSLSQLFGASAGVSAGVIGLMITKISAIYKVKLSDAVTEILKESFKGFFLAQGASMTVGMIPLFGNLFNGATQALITKKIGYDLIDKLERAISRAEREEDIKKILDENEKLRRRNDAINKALADIIDEEQKKNNK